MDNPLLMGSGGACGHLATDLDRFGLGEATRIEKRRDGAGLALEAHHGVWFRGQRVRQHLDRDLTPEPAVLGAEHLPHPALADELTDLVVAETIACTQSREGAS